jgi:phage baseplate assembly protein W
MAEPSSFFGTGWAFPPRFSRGGADVDLVSDEADIQQSLQILLSTQTGERVMQEGFGCDLSSVMFGELDQALVNAITSLISRAITQYEPRVTLARVDVTPSAAEPGLLLVEFDYVVNTTNSRYNYVFPFYIHEAVAPGVAARSL